MSLTPDTRNQPAWVISPWNRTGIEDLKLFSTPPLISDCTLRDGEQMAGVVFTRDDKVEIARQLDGLGIHDIEVGTPAVSDEDLRWQRAALAKAVIRRCASLKVTMPPDPTMQIRPVSQVYEREAAAKICHTEHAPLTKTRPAEHA